MDSQISLVQKYVKVVLVVALYWVVSISMVFLNKAVLGEANSTQDAPLFVTWSQCVVTAALCLAASRVAQALPGGRGEGFPRMGRLEPHRVGQVLPLSVVFVSMILFNNLCLKYVGVAFYYVGRSLSTVFNVVFSYLLLGQKTQVPAMVCCGVIIGGFMLGVDQEGAAGSLTLFGVVFGILAAASVALNSIYTKKVLPAVDNSIWQLSYYNNVLACVLFLPLMAFFGETAAIHHLLATAPGRYWLTLLTTGVCGFAIGYVTGLQIQVTSPLTHTISGTAKACAQTVLATSWYGETRGVLWWLSNFVVLGASLAYTRVKQLAMRQTHADQDISSEEKEGFVRNDVDHNKV